MIAASEAQAEGLWRLRESIAEAEKKDGPAAKHDISVPVAAMPGFLVDAAPAVEQRFPGTRVIALRPSRRRQHPFQRPRAAPARRRTGSTRRARRSPRYVHDLVTAAGGSISAEHGIGQTKTRRARAAPRSGAAGALRAIKAALDPHGIMNPGKLALMLTREAGERVADEWIAAWNAHDLPRVLAHYADDFEMASPKIARVTGEPSGRAARQARDCRVLGEGDAVLAPGLHFEKLGVYVGSRSVAIHYRNHEAKLVVEVLELDAAGRIVRAAAHYD